MKKEDIKIGFIGVGYMGYGMAHNLLKKNYPLAIIAHKNRKRIDILIKKGAIELNSFHKIAEFSNTIILCVTDTPTAIEVTNSILPYIKPETLFLDITTHNSNGSVQINTLLKNKKIRYVESPVMGGPVQSEQGVLGAIVGASDENFLMAKGILINFCKEIFHFGDIGIAAKTKLISNFLSLGTATLVIETLRAAKFHNIDLQKLYDVSKLGSGNSVALNRIADKLMEGDYKGYVFSVKNALKDLTYINELLVDLPNSKKLSSLFKAFYKEAVDEGKEDNLISELIKD